MKILVTGGAGFIGSHLVDGLIDDGHEVTVYDDLSGGSRANLNPKARFYNIDCRLISPISLMDLQPDVVFHLAANAAENKAQFSPIDITSRNYDASIKVLTASIRAGVKRFVFTSSIAVYGSLQTPFMETDTPQPEDLYGISKLAFENTLKVMSRVHNFEYVIVRPHNVYGERQNMTDPYRNVVTLFMNAVLKGQPYTIYGDGEQKRCFTYIDDCIEALVQCGFDDVAGKTFNIGSDRFYSINDLSDYIHEVTRTTIPPLHVDDRPQEVKVAIADHSQAKWHLSYTDRTQLIQGLLKTWNWCKQMGAQEQIFTPLELPSEKAPKLWQKHQ